LTHVEEKEAARAIRIATINGKPLQPLVLWAMVEAIRKRCIKEVNEDGVILINYEALRKHWLQ